jgi:coenzyme A diphosphatase NUDT7
MLLALARRAATAALAMETRAARRAAAPPPPPPPPLEALAAALAAAHPLGAPAPPPVARRRAAVLVALYAGANGAARVVLTRRAAALPTHAGEVCLPGGKREDGDADDAATALREAAEELGLDPAAVRLVAALPPVLSKHLLSVAPIVGVLAAPPILNPDPSEVAAAFSAPLEMFLSASTAPGRAHRHRDVTWEAGIRYRLHFWDFAADEEEDRALSAGGGGEHIVWGLTAGILVQVAAAAFGRAPAFAVHPPGCPPYGALAHEGGRLVFRGGGGAAQHAGGSAAEPGAVVTDAEAAAALGEARGGGGARRAGGSAAEPGAAVADAAAALGEARGGGGRAAG